MHKTVLSVEALWPGEDFKRPVTASFPAAPWEGRGGEGRAGEGRGGAAHSPTVECPATVQWDLE